jgi:hypothetical protein
MGDTGNRMMVDYSVALFTYCLLVLDETALAFRSPPPT